MEKYKKLVALSKDMSTTEHERNSAKIMAEKRKAKLEQINKTEVKEEKFTKSEYNYKTTSDYIYDEALKMVHEEMLKNLEKDSKKIEKLDKIIPLFFISLIMVPLILFADVCLFVYGFKLDYFIMYIGLFHYYLEIFKNCLNLNKFSKLFLNYKVINIVFVTFTSIILNHDKTNPIDFGYFIIFIILQGFGIMALTHFVSEGGKN